MANFRSFILFVVVSIILSLKICVAQTPQKETTHQSQQWIGYMTSFKISNKFSWWNDFHYVPEGFYVARTGITYHFPQSVNITAGYAYLGLPAGGVTVDLKRREHRPWGQMVISTPMAPHWSHLMRIRYDARFRRNVSQGMLEDGYGFNHRVRFLTSVRKQLPKWTFYDDWVPFVSISDEVLLNFGSEIIYNHLDQNRASATFGVRHKNISFQLGYMNRFVQLQSGNRFVVNHTLIFWVIHSFDRRRVVSPTP